MISSESPQAVWAGQQIASQGGNIVDVAVATGFALSVSHPQSGSLGGGGFAMIKIGTKTEVLDFREMAPLKTNPTFYLDKAKDASVNGSNAVGVPGVVAGLHALHKKYGKMKWSKLLNPAIQLAQKGVIVSRVMNETLNSNFKRFNEKGQELFLNKNGEIKKPGDMFKQNGLATTLTRIQKYRTNGFYKGPVAKDIVNTLSKGGGVMSLKDLKDYKVRWLKPIETRFKNHTVYLMPPPSSGGVVIASALKLIEKRELSTYPALSSLEAHLLIEILARSFRGRAHLGDPDFHKNPIEYLLSDEYLNSMHDSISTSETVALAPLKTIPKPTPSSTTSSSTTQTTLSEESTETTHYAAIDADGNAISITTTLNGNFGSGVFSNKFGISLNNEMDDFTTRPGEPNMFGLIQGEGNVVEPGKRPLSSMSPTIVGKDGKAVLALGARGGPLIISAVLQTLYRVLVTGYNIDQAIQAPRVHHQFLPNIALVDPIRISPDIIQKLKDRGHEIKTRDIAKVFGVQRRPNSLLDGAYDSRGEGAAGGK